MLVSNIAYPPYPWQRESWEHVMHLYQLKRLPHALLLSGKAGMGKNQFARAFSQVLLCNQPLAHSPCGECKSCLLFQSEDGHPDLLLIEPEGKLGIIKIEQIRDALEKVLQTSQQGGYRVIIINQAHAMNIASANALLKSLEEPGAKCVFLLISDSPHLLLPTIKSRCQQVVINAELQQAETWLLQHTKLNQNSVKGLWSLSGGSPLRAAELANSEGLQQQQQWVSKLLSANDPLALAQEYAQADLSQLLRWTIALLADLIKLRSFAKLPLSYMDYQLPMSQMVAQVSLNSLYVLLDKYYQLNNQAQMKISLNQQLILEDLLIEWNRLFFSE